MTLNWVDELVEQLDWHWRTHLRPRLDGLSDEEYFWEPVDGCWSVRPRGEGRAAWAVGTGDWLIDFELPEPQPPPVTTIAWRLGHVNAGVLGARVAGHFGGPAADYDSYAYAGTADEALAQLDVGYAAWTAGVRALGEQGLAEPCGPAEGTFAEAPMASLVLHVNRETLHHGAEIALLRDLYAHR